MRYNIKTLLILTVGIAVSLSVLLIVKGAIQTRVIVAVDHSIGTRLRVIQCFNYRAELFTTSMYFDDGDGKWRWYYIDHQDTYWGNAATEITNSKIYVTSKSRQIEFDTSTGECTVFHFGRRRDHEKSNRIHSLPPGVDDVPNPRKNAG